jgi:hypothetical protein
MAAPRLTPDERAAGAAFIFRPLQGPAIRAGPFHFGGLPVTDFKENANEEDVPLLPH